MTLAAWIVVTCVSLVFSSLFSGVEIAYITSGRVSVELEIKKGGVIGRILGRFYKSSELFISTLLVGNNVMLVVYGMGAALLLEGWLAHFGMGDALVLAGSTLISTMVILLVGEFFPKTIFRINPTLSLKLFAVPVFILYLLFWPISAFTSWLSRGLMLVVGIDSLAERSRVLSTVELNSYIERNLDLARTESDDGRPEVEQEVKMLHNALDFADTLMRDCMVPRNELVAVDLDDTSRDELSRLFTSTGRSKILVYKEDIDNIVGYIHVSELFNPDTDWREHMKPVLFAPETLRANVMMRRLLSEKRSMAVVIDEFGGTAGIVTLEDLVEEIFGDIKDEHDKPDMEPRVIADNVFEFPGRIEVKTLRDDFMIDIPEDDAYQTLAGYVIHSLGELPELDREVEIDGYRIKVLRRTATRLELIRVDGSERKD